MNEFIRCEESGGILTVALDRPDRRNALTAGMLDELQALFEGVGARPEVRVLLLRGVGKDFCTGLDLGEMAAAKGESGAVRLDPIAEMFVSLENVPQPTIAAVQGAAVAGGCELSLHCDLRVAADDVRFAMPLAKLGLALPLRLVQKLVEILGSAATRELLFTGSFFDAVKAAQLQMVTRVVPRADLDAEAKALAEQVAANAPLSLRALKRSILRSNAFRHREEAEDLVAELAAVSASEDAGEGVCAMRERRPPLFRGR